MRRLTHDRISCQTSLYRCGGLLNSGKVNSVSKLVPEDEEVQGRDEVKRIGRDQDKFQTQAPGTTVRVPMTAPKLNEQLSN